MKLTIHRAWLLLCSPPVHVKALIWLVVNLFQVLHVSLINWAQVLLKYLWPLSKCFDLFFLRLIVKDVGLCNEFWPTSCWWLRLQLLSLLPQLLMLLLAYSVLYLEVFLWSPPSPLHTNVFLTQCTGYRAQLTTICHQFSYLDSKGPKSTARNCTRGFLWSSQGVALLRYHANLFLTQKGLRSGEMLLIIMYMLHMIYLEICSQSYSFGVKI